MSKVCFPLEQGSTLASCGRTGVAEVCSPLEQGALLQQLSRPYVLQTLGLEGLGPGTWAIPRLQLANGQIAILKLAFCGLQMPRLQLANLQVSSFDPVHAAQT